MKRRQLLKLASSLPFLSIYSQVHSKQIRLNPLIVIITFRGQTDVEKGFKSYLAQTHFKPEYLEFDIDRDVTQVQTILDRIRAKQPALVLTWGTSVTQAVAGTVTAPNKNKLNCPTVFALVTAPVASGIVESLEGSNRNVTGVFHVATPEQQIQAIERYRPFKKLGMVYTPTENNSVVIRNLMAKKLEQNGMELIALPAELDPQGKPIASSLSGKVDQLAKAKIDWLYLPPDSFIGAHAQSSVIPAAHAHKIPTFATTEQLMKAGALLGLVCSYFEIGQFAGFKASQILENNLFAGKVPVETLQTYSLRINPERARALSMPPPLNLFNVAKFQS